MAISEVGHFGDKIFKDVDSNATVEEITAPTNVHDLEIDNSNNTEDSVLKAWDQAATPTLGTTEPDWIIQCPAASKRGQPLGDDGVALAAGDDFFFACTKTSALGGTTGPTNDVGVTVRVTA